MKYLIIGNGIAGTHAAETIRKFDHRSNVIVVSKEKTVPYSRPLISYVVSGELQDYEITIRSEEFYDKLGIEAYLGKSVVEVDVNDRVVRLSSGELITWDRMLIASGADPRMLDVEGSDLGNIFALRNINDAKAIVESCTRGATKAIVLGGGLVGFKAAYGLLKRGLDVSIFISSSYPLSQAADKISGRLIMETLEDHGLKVEVGRSVVAFEGKRGKVREAYLKDGKSVECDLVVVGKGVNPAVQFLRGCGIETGRGIIVNHRLQSNIPDIYAAGDVAEAPDVVWGENRVNAIWPVAVEQGKIAALNMLGIESIYRGSFGRNVIRIFDLDFMAGGIVNPPDDDDYEIVEDFNETEKKYKKLVFREDCLVGIVLVNCIDQGGVLLNLIAQKRTIRYDRWELLAKDDYYPIFVNYRRT